MSLLEKAKAYGTTPKNHSVDEECELFEAWARGEVSMTQVAHALKGPASKSAFSYAALLRGAKAYYFKTVTTTASLKSTPMPAKGQITGNGYDGRGKPFGE